MRTNEKTEKKPEPKKTYGGYATKEESDARDREFSSNLKKGGEDWIAKHGKNVAPKVF